MYEVILKDKVTKEIKDKIIIFEDYVNNKRTQKTLRKSESTKNINLNNFDFEIKTFN